MSPVEERISSLIDCVKMNDSDKKLIPWVKFFIPKISDNNTLIDEVIQLLRSTDDESVLINKIMNKYV